jgi:Uma2 family endonuclease
MQQTVLKYISPAEYLAMEEVADTRSEYYRGEIFNMAGASFDHNLITNNVSASLNIGLKNTECYPVQSDMLLRVEAVDLFTYPDVLVICGKPVFYENRKNVVTNPLLIIEVLSESTRNYDRGDKFEFYRKIPAFQEYVLIDQYKVHVEHFHLTGDDGKWIFSEYNDLRDTLALAKIDFQISLRDIYYRVELGGK